MKLNLPYKVRAAIYIGNVLLSPVVAYLFAIHVIDGNLAALWATEVSAAFALAGLNITKKN